MSKKEPQSKPVVNSLSWKEAIIRVLGESPTPMHYSDVAGAIVSSRLRENVGSTPAATVAATIANEIKRQTAKNEKPDFVRVDRGVFMLSDVCRARTPAVEKKPSAVDVIDEEANPLITSFGMYWLRKRVSWKNNPTLIGQQQGAEPVDFSEQRGVYLLHDNQRIVYVGQAVDRGLGTRLLEHTRDRLNGRWDRFSWFGMLPVREDGKLAAKRSDEEDVVASMEKMISSYEAILIEAAEPPLNRQSGKEMRASEYLQVEDPEKKTREKRKKLKELLEMEEGD